MKVRRAELSDAPTIAKIGTLAFARDPSYGHFYPWREQYPQDFYRRLLHNYKKMMVTPGELIVVVELDKSDQEKSTEDLKDVDEAGKIVGYATLRRSGGTKEEHYRWNADSTSKKIKRWTMAITDKVSSIIHPNRAVCESALDSFWSQAFQIHASTSYTGKLDFLTLAVLPEYQRRGVGEKLMDYAGFRAVKENIPVFGDATEKGLPLYLKNGGKQIGVVVMPDTTYEKKGGKMPMKATKLETPVLRWDAANVAKARLDQMAPVADAA